MTVLPLVLWIGDALLGRHFPSSSRATRQGTLAIVTSLGAALVFAVFYHVLTQFGPFHRHRLHPGWSSPRLVLFMELNPFYGWLLPVTLFMRGHIMVAFVRWALNITAFALLAVGEGVLAPAYAKACCYGRDFLTGTEAGGHCDADDVHSARGFYMCDEEGHSDNHKALKGWAYLMLVVSFSIQIANILLVDYDVVERVARMEQDIRDNKLVTNAECQNKEGRPAGRCTVDIALIFERMGMPRRLIAEVFVGREEKDEMNDFFSEKFITRSQRVHRHPHWCHPGLYRMLCLDPIFGLGLSVHDFLGYSNTRGIVRILCNVWGATAIFLAVEILQPMHRAWCCYGTGRRLADENLDGVHYTCAQWISHFESTNDKRIADVFTDSPLFPNGSCMQHDTLGLAAAWCFVVGVLLLMVSVGLWTFAFVSVDEACQRSAATLYYAVKPVQRRLLIQVYNYMGIEHGVVQPAKKLS